MILFTVGMPLRFDRLIAAIDRIAAMLGMPVTAQICAGTYQAKNMDVRPKIALVDFERLMREARLVVNHAGIGTVLTASRLGRPVMLMPRRADRGNTATITRWRPRAAMSDVPGS